jgi:predicted metal-dependent hydrolase
MMQESIEFGSRSIPFVYRFSERRTLGITVTPEMQVLVNAPSDATMAAIKEKVKEKAPWILKQLSYFLSFHPLTPARRFISGETHLYLGKQYRLKVFESDIQKVRMYGGFIEVYYNQHASVEELMLSWYHLQALRKFEEFAEPWISRFKKYQVAPASLQLKEMKYRWGSCSAQGNILLNPELIKAPKACIEYVIVHELCHLVHLNHNHQFFELQTKEMPDWEKWKDKLERILA